MITLKYCGSQNGRLKEGMYLNVPTNWAKGICGNITADAISEIMEVLEEKSITVNDYDHVFATMKDTFLKNDFGRHGRNAGKVLLCWKKV